MKKQSSTAEDGLQTDHIVLVVLNIYAKTSEHLRAYLSQDATVSAPDPAYEAALELFENTRLGGDVIWINAEGVTLQELAALEKHWLPIAGKAILLMGATLAPLVNRSLHGLMAARQENHAFQAVILTAPEASAAATTSRLMATQSAGWLRHESKNLQTPLITIRSALQTLGLTDHSLQPPSLAKPAKSAKPANSAKPAPASKIRPAPALPPTGNSPLSTLNESVNACMHIDGALGAALCDYSTGMALAKAGGGGVNLDLAAAGNAEVVKAKLNTMATLGIQGAIEDMLITLDEQYHLIRPIPHTPSLFLYLVLDKAKSNLAMARLKLKDIEKNIIV